MKKLLTLLALAAAPAQADIAEVVEGYILPGYMAFAETTAEFGAIAAESCELPVLRNAWNDSFDAWLAISPIQFGPVELQGRALAIAFWPDERGTGARVLASLRADQDPIIFEPGGAARLSAAARGFFALEYLLFDEAFTPTSSYDCALIAALGDDLAQQAAAVLEAWQGGYAETLQTAGAEGNLTFLSAREAQQALFTALLVAVEFNADTRLGRPMGTFERPRPLRAESRRAGRSLRNVALSLEGAAQLARRLTTVETPNTTAAFAHAQALIADLDDPDFAGVATPQGRFKLEALQQAIRSIRDAILLEIGPSLGVVAGFNASDGD
tara:strand:- start:1337 stop:2317 length:981 start_codon:yes stop_codon:yes gene_type:complete